jgi:hypothetical protein
MAVIALGVWIAWGKSGRLKESAAVLAIHP